MKTIHVLVVDDDLVDRQALRRAFAGTVVAVDIEEAASAAEVFERLSRGGCDCVLLDYGLPGLNGLETLAEIRRRGFDVPVIMLTGNGDQRVAVELMKAGAADYLVKQDLTPDRLERSVRHALAMADLARLRGRLLAYEQGARREAQAENAAKDEFLATLSHELRTPLNVILGWARLLAGDTVDERDRLRAYDAIERNASALARHIDDLLDVSRIVSGNLTLTPEPTDVVPTVAQVVDSLRPAAAAKHITLTQTNHGAARLVTVDPARLSQIVMNLVSNAIKFTPDRGYVHVDVAFESESLVIEVRDTGVGISDEFLPHVFARFRQADPSQSRRHGGLGLGLSIVQQLVHMHAGMVQASSAGEGKGSQFRVTLPYAQADTTRRARRARNPGHRLTGLRILMVDDEPDACELATILLQLEGAEVTTATSAAQARVALATHEYDVLLSDISMPEEDGYSLIETIRRDEQQTERPRLPAAALTALARPIEHQRAIEAGYDEFLSKPFTAAALVATVAATAGHRAHH
ncbi:MAG TPA: response regulator [Vicinamibacterales bacterium]|nr:response regulator [Vicinamibacterales bacterium]